MERNPLDKQKFMGGNRQKWLLAFLLCAGGVLLMDATVPNFDPTPYLTFLTVIGPSMLVGLTFDANAKIKNAPKPEPDEGYE